MMFPPGLRTSVLARRSRGTPTPQYGLITKTTDGSVGQTYTLNAAWTGVQWYRQNAGTGARTLIAGATNLTYVAQAADIGFKLAVTGSGGLAVSYEVVLAAPVLLASFDASASWTAGQGATLGNDTTRKVQGTGSLSLTGDGTQQGIATNAALGTLTPSGFGAVAYYYDAGSDPEMAQFSPGGPRIGQGGSYVFGNTITDGAGQGTPNDFRLNGYWDSLNVSATSSLGSMGSGTTGARIYGQVAGSPFNGTVRYDALMANAGGMPTLVIGFDDARPGQYSIGKALLEARGFRATFYLPTATIDQASRLTSAQVLDLAAAGHDIQLDGTSDDNIITDLATQQLWLNDLAAQKAWFAGKGLPVPQHLCYPNGTYRIAGTRIAPTTALVNGVAAVTMASTTGIVAGMKVVGGGLPTTGTFSRVLNVDSGTQVTLTIAPTVTGSRLLNFTDDSGPWHTGKLQALMLANGIVSGRSTFASGTYKSSRLTRFGEAGGILVHAAQGVTGYTASQMRAGIDEAILHGRTVEYYMHDVVAGSGVNPSINVNDTNFTDWLDYAKAKVDAGQLVVLTKAQQWARDGASGVPL